MKKLLLSIFLFFSSVTFANAQSAYIPFADNMIIYAAGQHNDMDGLDPPSFFRTEIAGDTVIGAYTYYKQYAGTSSITFAGGFRNDTLNKKVYKYYPSLGAEKLFYDFDLNVGDTVNSSSGFGFYDDLVAVSSIMPTPDVDTAWVYSIDSVLMPHDGVYHRRFNFKGKLAGFDSVLTSETNSTLYANVGGWSHTILMHSLVEGVGQLSNPVSYHDSGAMGFPYVYYYGTLCASVNGIAIINTGAGPPGYDPAYCNSMYTGIGEEKTGSRIAVYPNPTDGYLKVKTQQKMRSLIIADVLGKVVYSCEPNSLEMQVDLSALRNGIYFLHLNDADGTTIINKIVKH